LFDQFKDWTCWLVNKSLTCGRFLSLPIRSLAPRLEFYAAWFILGGAFPSWGRTCRFVVDGNVEVECGCV